MRPVAFLRQEVAGFALRRLAPQLQVAASRWRSSLRHTRFIAVTGSLGKTTAKECLAAILETRGPTFMSVGTQNAGWLLCLNLLRVRPRHRFAVIETAAGYEGSLLRAARIVRPHLAIIVSIAQAHTSSLGRLEGIAREKLSLLTGLGPDGVAVVNGDEPLLAEAGAGEPFRVLRFGAADSGRLDLAVEEVLGFWPRRLQFTARSGSESARVETRLVGAHWVPSVSAALLAAGALGVSLDEASAAVSRVRPHPARMQPVGIPGGVTILRDDFNGTPSSWEAAFAVMAGAQARRRILVTGDFSDSPLGPRKRLRRMGRSAAAWADLAVFVGADSHYAREGTVSGGLSEDSVFHSGGWEDAAAWLKPRLRAGDLVLLKGRIRDHLARLLHALTGPVGCHRTQCPRRYLCDECWDLGVPARRRNLVEELEGGR